MKKTFYLWLIAIVIIGVKYTNAQVTGYGCTPYYTSLVEGPNGYLYGMTRGGGENEKGVIFKYRISDGAYTKLVDFDGDNGEYPWGSLYFYSEDEMFYGMTSGGGIYEKGVIFQFDPSDNSIVVNYHFDGTNGEYPHGSLVLGYNLDNEPRLYGMTSEGGSYDYGVIFEFNPNTGLGRPYTKLIDFGINAYSGRNPQADLIQAFNGKFYGTTMNGGVQGEGVIFEFSLGSMWQPPSFTYQHSCDQWSGQHPTGNLIVGFSDDLLYGMNSTGGGGGFGDIFELDIDGPYTPYYSQVYYFYYTDGANPQGSLTKSSTNGIFYGMTEHGNNINLYPYGWGVLFELDITPTPSTVSVKHAFDYSLDDGTNPFGSILIKSGTLYGLTSYGGENMEGTVFWYSSQYGYAKAIDFSCTDDLDFTNVNEEDLNEIRVYPNPASDYVMINNAENSNIQVFDVLGNKVLDINNIRKEYRMDISKFSQGTYIIKIIQNEQVITKKISLIK